MLLNLMERYHLPASATLMIGDREVDMEAAANAGVEGLLFGGGHLLHSFEEAGHLQRLSSNAASPEGLRDTRR